MGVLDQFCRFCTQMLDHSERRNIFEAENSRLLEIALRCIPLPMAANDRYPNFTCYPCAYKLNDIAQFQSNGLSAVNFFDEFLAENEKNSSTSAENCHEVIIKNELFEETETDFVEELTPKLETIRSENEIEDVDHVQYEADLLLPPHHLKECVVKLVRLDDISPAMESIPAKQAENVPLGVDEESSSKNQCIAETDSQQINNVGSTKNPFFCDLCNKTFMRQWDLTSHLCVHIGEKPLQCQYCRKLFNNKGNMDRHIQTHTAEKSFACEYCKESFTCKANLVSHVKTHTGEKPFECEYCKKKFKTMANLKVHIRIHTGEKPFGCEYCKKCFGRKQTLLNHLKTHSTEKKFECEYCKKNFKCRWTLKSHSRVHTKPLKCGFCDERFSHKNVLLYHVRTHTGEKPFKCELCNKRFIVKGTLVKHVKTHSSEKPFKCELCNKSFDCKKFLVRHAGIHTREKFF